MLEVHNHTLVVKSLDKDVLGYVEPRLGSRLVRLINQGNRYEGAILSAGAERITVIIRGDLPQPHTRRRAFLPPNRHRCLSRPD